MRLLRDIARGYARRTIRRAVASVVPEPVRSIAESAASTYDDTVYVGRVVKSAREMARPEFIEEQRDRLAHEVDRVRHAERVARVVHRRAKERSR